MTFPTSEHIFAAQTAADRLKVEDGVYIWPSVSLAQALIESAGWTELSGVNNGFGIKATQDEIAKGEAKLVMTHETIKGVYETLPQYFVNFPSLADAYFAHARLLATSVYYKLARSTTTPQAFAVALTGIYATGIPGHPYGQELVKLMNAGNYYQYDHGAGASSSLPPSQLLACAKQMQAGVKGFQTVAGLLVDGDPGEITRGAYLKALQG